MTVVAPERIVASGGAPKRRARVWLIALVIGMIVGAGVTGLLSADSRPGPGWHRIASMSELRNEEVLTVDGSGVILVLDRGEPIALSALDGRGQPVVYCETSGWFQDVNHGSQFDRLGHYALGPAPRGLDRFAVLVLGDDVFVDRTQVMKGAPRYQPEAGERVGPFCAEIIRETHS
jgi:hypothetical protein